MAKGMPRRYAGKRKSAGYLIVISAIVLTLAVWLLVVATYDGPPLTPVQILIKLFDTEGHTQGVTPR